MKKYILFDHDGVLVETEQWYYLANKRALASLGIDLPRDAYLANMANGVSAWEAARAAGISESEISRGREVRNRYYQEYLMTEDVETVVIEDSARGLKSAIAAGIDCIVVANEFTAAHDLSEATAKVATFRELPSTINGLASSARNLSQNP